MAVRYGKFELPTTIRVEESAKRNLFARFIAEPFENGYGHTVGNALRRILLTSMEAPAIISVKFEGVSHEYMAIEGVVEDMTHLILNLKGALLRKLPTDKEVGSHEPKTLTHVLDVTSEMLERGGGQYTVRLQDLISSSEFELVNPDLPIFSVTQPMTKRVDIKVAIGRGYVPSERHIITDKVVDEIVVDSAFSPVRLVNFFIESTRVGQDTDFDRLVLEITTDGRVTPEEALNFATQIATLHLEVFNQIKTHEITFDKGEAELNTDRDALVAKLALKINEIELSVRSTNCLAGANIDTIAELVIMPESEMLKFRNFGKKSLNEIKAKLEEMGLSLGMDLTKFGIDRDNVKTIISDYLKDKIGSEV